MHLVCVIVLLLAFVCGTSSEIKLKLQTRGFTQAAMHLDMAKMVAVSSFESLCLLSHESFNLGAHRKQLNRRQLHVQPHLSPHLCIHVHKPQCNAD